MAGQASKLRWSVGVTTVPERRDTLLPRTVASLCAAGFSNPVLYVDGCGYAEAAEYESRFNLEVEVRRKLLRPFGNWVQSLWNLWLRDNRADRYAIFQDDCVAVRNLRAYLEECRFPEKGYLNLYTFRSNEEHLLQQGIKRGWHPSHQHGRGAVGLVFDREGVMTVLSSRDNIVARPDCKNRDEEERWWRSLDGGVVTAMNKAGFREWVHLPSLLDHTGKTSSMDKNPRVTDHDENFVRQPVPDNWATRVFPGEDFDAMTLIEASPFVDPEKVREIEAVRKALAEDAERLARPNLGVDERLRLERWQRTYKERLAKLGS